MTHPVLGPFSFSNVYEKEMGPFSFIHFSYQQFEFFLKLIQDGEEHEFMLLDLIHNTSDKLCPFCQKTRTESTDCVQMEPHLSVLMDQLIHFPKLRLKWLFRDYI